MADIAFFGPADDGRLAPLPYARSLWAPNTLNGPAVCAVAAHAAETEFGRAGFRPARFTIDLFKAAKEVPTSTRSRLVRDGGRIRVVEVDVLQHPDDGAEVLTARSTTVFLAESANPPGQRWQRPESAVTFHAPLDTPSDHLSRFASDESGAVGDWDADMGAHQNGLRKRLWAQPLPAVLGSPATPFTRAVTGAESTSLICNWGSSGIGFINCDLTVALSRLPRGRRIGVEADSHTEFDGISASSAGLYDIDGMWGIATVTAVNNAAAEIDFTTVDVGSKFLK